MKRDLYTLLENAPLTASVYRMRLAGDTQAIVRPGQFVNIALAGRFLRRPISVCDYDAGSLTLIYKVVGEGTAQLARMRPGQHIQDNIMRCNFGNPHGISGFQSGVGVPPLYNLAKVLRTAGKPVQVVVGFNTAAEVFYAEEFRALGCSVTVATADGTCGMKGFVTDALAGLDFDYFYACGPLPMLRALSAATTCDGQLSFEERMGCGFGACMGCSCKTLTGGKRICKEGPVLMKNEILW